MSENESQATPPAASTPWYHRIGPGLITACVVIGPGSILTSSNVGARYGYGLSWVVLVAAFFMLVYMTLGARLGVAAKESAGALLTKHVGRWFAALIGISVFFISAAFQFGNNLGVHYAMVTYLDFDYLVVGFNLLAIGFLLVFRDMYRALEKLMMVFVGMMLLAFLTNLGMSGPRLGEWLQGFVPGRSGAIDLSVLGLIGTTFVTTAAFYQSYLVRQKGWHASELKSGMIDVRIGVVLMALITLMLMATPATLFHPEFRYQQIVTDPGDSELVAGRTLVLDDADSQKFDELKAKVAAEKDVQTNEPKWDAVLSQTEFAATVAKLDATAKKPSVGPRGFGALPEVGLSLRPLFGPIGPHLFFLGVFAAAYSSFLVNSMIGGFILADGLGLGNRPTDLWPKVFTIAVLVTGMLVGLYCIVVLKGGRPVGLIVAAQAVTVVASPLVAGSLLYLTSRKSIMGSHTSGPLLLGAGGLGLLLLLVISFNLARKLLGI